MAFSTVASGARISHRWSRNGFGATAANARNKPSPREGGGRRRFTRAPLSKAARAPRLRGGDGYRGTPAPHSKAHIAHTLNAHPQSAHPNNRDKKTTPTPNRKNHTTTQPRENT